MVFSVKLRKIAQMRELFELLIQFFVTILKLSRPGGVKLLVAENQLLKQQLIVINRHNKRSPKLKAPPATVAVPVYPVADAVIEELAAGLRQHI